MERVMRSTIIVNPKLREREGQASTYLVDAQRKSAHSTAQHTRHIAAQETHDTRHTARHTTRQKAGTTTSTREHSNAQTPRTATTKHAAHTRNHRHDMHRLCASASTCNDP
mmetsp:Transcript_63068/g.137088  ORF Transcript_63068/g.137088 Transcript_63068/m.137088 type:complete len:111 (+) Transcript_63068:19-351(+)